MASLNGEYKLELFHYRLLHRPLGYIKEIYKRRQVVGLTVERALLHRSSDHKCVTCLRAKPSRHHFGRKVEADGIGLEPIFGPGDCIDFDWADFTKEPARDGTKLFANFSDRATGRVWGMRATEKSEFPKLLDVFYTTIVNGVSPFVMKRFHSDSGTEIVSKEVKAKLISWHVVQTSSPVDTPELNGYAEQMNRMLGEACRAILIGSGLGVRFWADAYAHCIMVNDMLPRQTTLGFMSPYQAWTGRLPDVSVLRVWGCECFVKMPRNQIRKDQSERALVGHYIGNSINPIGYIVHVPSMMSDVKERVH